MVPTSARDLYALDPNDFVAARDALARELRSKGEKDDAAQVKALRRPPVPVWALNQVSRRQPDAVDALLAAGAAARGAKNETVRAALADLRTHVREIVHAARVVIEESGRPADPHELDLTSALSAIVVSEPLAADLRDGVLTQLGDDGAELEWPAVTPTAAPPSNPVAKEASKPKPTSKPTSEPEPEPPRPSRQLIRAREKLERLRAAAEDAAARVAEAQRAHAAAVDAVQQGESEVARLEG